MNRHTEEYKSIYGGKFTVKDLEAYVENATNNAQTDIRIYFEYYINKKSLRDVAKIFGVSHETIKKRMHRMMGLMNAYKSPLADANPKDGH